MRALEADLNKQWKWNAKRLGPLVDRLGKLMTRKSDLKLFLELISQQQRASVGRVESPRGAISRLAAKVFEARTLAAGPDFPGSEARRQTELRHLD